ncbi:hypothetical protein CONPUDRAFT_165067 [Coniophora puteana RWD-64-598 SS2]|uniref:Uncharacterized protein n=1 Tax=Coniophora puteana (strain RWD-64-598) TaxID=741705 RepID=A0A5M3MV59_CONPW|nr:uncharacterized protein CONPUDRAFT_165067 [Coniophora puteana RWD-64-598 SS2]EIW82481.1 hypothetical protein CONPUDRAFT_165067 [Coniophora puteana RWD-64-598 SS2]
MLSPTQDDLPPLPRFSRRTMKAHGPRPCSWASNRSSLKPDLEHESQWPTPVDWCPRLSRMSTSSSLSSRYSESTQSHRSSCSLDPPPYYSVAQERRQSKAEKPKGPRRLPTPPDSPARRTSFVRPLPPLPPLSVNVSLNAMEGREALSPSEPASLPLPHPSPEPPSPSDDIIDWDLIYEALGCA